MSRTYKLDQIDLSSLLAIACQAGQAIMNVYYQDFEVIQKTDGSPLTMADKQSNKIISDYLSQNYDLPILSEENDEIPFEIRKNWTQYWLIDPLDGTKEFVHKRREFTVNIALIQNNQPVLGVIYAPMFQELFYAIKGKGSYFQYKSNTITLKSNSTIGFQFGKIIHRSDQHIKLILSRSHSGNCNVLDFLEDKSASIQTISMGSSLKFCRVSQAKVDANIRITPTMEWDTAAGQVIVEESGRRMYDLISLQPLSYNKQSLVNPGFIVY